MRFQLKIIIPIIMIFTIPLYPWHSLPGSGLNITTNIITWLLLGFFGLWLCIVAPLRRLRNGLVSKLLFCGLILQNLPISWTSSFFLKESLYRLGATTALALLLWRLLQIPIRGAVRHRIYLVIIAMAVIQALICFWQSLFPQYASYVFNYHPWISGGRTAGSFGQANLAGSFLATGFLCSIYLTFTYSQKHIKRPLQICSVLLCSAMILSGSHTAWIGALVGICILFWLAHGRRSKLEIATIVALGVLVAQGTIYISPTLMPVYKISKSEHASDLKGKKLITRSSFTDERNINHQAAEQERLALIKGALAMISSRPIVGYGVGSFEHAFPVVMSENALTNPFTVTVSHPHNELLYVWSEGGLVALGGLLCWLYLWCLPFSASKSWGGKSRFVIARGVITLPLMAHVMLEYPFYLSVQHSLLMVLLLWLALPVRVRYSRGALYKLDCRVIQVAQICFISFCIAGIIFSATGLESAWEIKKAESQGLNDLAPLIGLLNPYAQVERREFDLAVSDLMQYNKTSQARWLYAFQRTAGDWLTRHNDPNLINTMMIISLAQQDRKWAEYWRMRGCMSFHSDSRFQCIPVFK